MRKYLSACLTLLCLLASAVPTDPQESGFRSLLVTAYNADHTSATFSGSYSEAAGTNPYIAFTVCGVEPDKKNPQPIAPENIKSGGDLLRRVSMNFDRLEEEKYRPSNVFLTDIQSRGWPGDTEGRTILGLVLDARTTGRTPKYLDSILFVLPTKLNEKGYMGTVYKNEMNEQQLSGNGWMLRGLCEYYSWKKDPKVLKYIQTISQNLFVAGKGYYSKYPIDPGLRKKEVGEMVGTTQGTTNGWILSSDVGCLFIGMDGAIQAYSITKDPKLKEVIDEMIARFYQIDFVKVKAQTHATLTGLRGLILYAELTNDFKYLEKVEKVWLLYKQFGMTENFENYNWFCRYDTLIIPFLSNSTLNISNNLIIKQQTDYPQKGQASFEIQKADSKISCIKISFHPRFAKKPVLKMNGQIAQVVLKSGFIILTKKLKANDKIELNFENTLRFEKPINQENIASDSRKVVYGPLVLGFESDKSISIDQSSALSNSNGEFKISSGADQFVLTPIYHLMDSHVWKDSGYQKQILFSNIIAI